MVNLEHAIRNIFTSMIDLLMFKRAVHYHTAFKNYGKNKQKKDISLI